MSRRNTGRPQRIRRGLPAKTSERCPDCELMGNLDIVGKPRRIGLIPLRGSSASKWRPVATVGCETCDGTGRLSVNKPDPYDTGRGTQQFTS